MSGSELHLARLPVAIVIAAALVAVAAWVGSAGTAGVVATLCLGAATVWLGWQSRRAIQQAADFRVQEKQDRMETALRAALVEQTENCRHWLSHDPMVIHEQVDDVLLGWSPAFTRFEQLVADVDLPPALLTQLLWLVAAAKDANHLCHELLKDGMAAEQLLTQTDWHLAWWRQLDHLQAIACYFMAEAKRLGFADLAATFGAGPWFGPQVCPSPTSGSPTVSIRYSRPAELTDPAYAGCTQAARAATAQQLVDTDRAQ